MEQKNLVTNSLIAVGIFAAVIICVGMASGFAVTKPLVSLGSLSDKNTGSLSQEKYIHVDAVGDKTVGDIFTVTGTTNLATGTSLQVEIMPATFEPEGGVNGEFSGAMGHVDVIAGTGGTNTWSMEVNSSTLNPVKMLVNVSVFTGDVLKGDYSTSGPIGTREFTIHPASGSASGSQASATGKFIRIDPVADKTAGDLLIVSGSTNLPAETFLMVQTGSFGTNALVREGTGSVNRFSVPVDTAILKPGTLAITVTQMNNDYSLGTLTGTGSFTLKGPSLVTETPVQPVVTKNDYIRLKAIGPHAVGDQFLITGTTSLPAGSILLWQILPDTGAVPATVDKNASGIMANAPVTKGDGTANRVSFAVDLSGQKPGTYIAAAGVLKGEDAASRDIRMGDLVGSAVFTVTAAPSGAVTFAPIGDRKTGDRFTVTGTTNLPAGTNLFWEILPDSGKTPTGVDLDAPVGIMANNQVIGGTGSSNRVSLDVNMTEMKPGKYVVTVASLAGDPQNVNPATGVLAGYTYFSLK